MKENVQSQSVVKLMVECGISGIIRGIMVF